MQNQLKRKGAKIIIILIIISVSTTWMNQCFGQNSSVSDTIQIHKVVVAKLAGDKNFVLKMTNKSPFRDFDFKDPTQLDTSSTMIWKRKDWKIFLNKIDTANTGNYTLSSNGKYWFKSSNMIPAEYDKTIEFAPIFISQEGNKSLILLKTYNILSHSGSHMAYFLEKQKNLWVIKKSFTYTFID